MFSDNYIKQTEERFDKVFERLYDEQVISILYCFGDSIISFEEFTRRFNPRAIEVGQLDKKKTTRPEKMDWLFSPIKVYIKFKSAL